MGEINSSLLTYKSSLGPQFQQQSFPQLSYCHAGPPLPPLTLARSGGPVLEEGLNLPMCCLPFSFCPLSATVLSVLVTGVSFPP